MTKEKKIFQQLTSKDICLVYERLQNKGEVSFPLTGKGKLKVDSLVASINSFYFGKEIYSKSEEKAVAYLYFLIKNHPFTDGNKRTATLCFKVVCNLNDLDFNSKHFPLDELAVYVESIKEEDHQSVIKELASVLFD